MKAWLTQFATVCISTFAQVNYSLAYTQSYIYALYTIPILFGTVLSLLVRTLTDDTKYNALIMGLAQLTLCHHC